MWPPTRTTGINAFKLNLAAFFIAAVALCPIARSDSVTLLPDPGSAPLARPAAATQAINDEYRSIVPWLEESARHAAQTTDPLERGQLAGALAINFARCNDEDRMRSNMHEAQRLVIVPANETNPLDELFAHDLPDIVRCMARHGDLQSTGYMLKSYGGPRVSLIAAQTAIAVGQAEAGDIPGSQVTLAAIGDIANNDGNAKIAKALADLSRIPQARAAAEQITDTLWKSKAYVQIVQSQEKQGDDAGAMDSADRIPEGPAKAEAYRVIAAYRASRGEDVAANIVAGMITDTPVRSRAFFNIGRCQVQRKDFAAASGSLEHTIDSDRQMLMTLLAIGQANADDLPAAKELFPLIVDLPSRKLACRAIIYAMVRQGDIFGARSFLQPLPTEQRIELLLALARIAADVGNPQIALRILHEVETGVANPGTRIVGPLIRNKAKDKEGFDAAIRSYEHDAAVSPNTSVRGKANAMFFVIKASTGDIAGARDAANKVADPFLSYIVAATTERLDTGDATDALGMASALPSVPLQINAYQAIAEHALKDGKPLDYHSLIHSLPTPRDQSACCLGIAQALLHPPSPAD